MIGKDKRDLQAYCEVTTISIGVRFALLTELRVS